MTKPYLDGETLFCPVCGVRYTPALPCPLRLYAAILRQFNLDHMHCTGDSPPADASLIDPDYPAPSPGHGF
jgi:hypothetical protein